MHIHKTVVLEYNAKYKHPGWNIRILNKRQRIPKEKIKIKNGQSWETDTQDEEK